MRGQTKTNKNNGLIPQSQSGFTLVELAVVIIIGGILMTFAGSALFTFVKKQQITETQTKLEEIKSAMLRYLEVNGRYPCAASRTLVPTDAQFGREVTTTCNSGTFAGTARNGNVRIGAVPTRTLNLSDDHAADAWDNKFTFAVTEVLATQISATQTGYTEAGGRVIVVDRNNLSLVTPANTAHYAVVSHGKSGQGAFGLNSTARNGACTNAGTLDGENCNDNRRFRSTLINSDAATNQFYDDYVVYKGQSAPNFIIESCTVMAFNRSSCPDGWSELTQARGRFIVGGGAGVSITLTRENLSASDPITNQTYNLNLGNSSSDGDNLTHIPPYLSLLYCQKLPNVGCAF